MSNSYKQLLPYSEMKFSKMKKLFCGLVLAGLPLALSGQQAQIGDATYATLAEAFAAANADDTITLLGDVTVDNMIPVTKSVTLDLAGHTLTNDVKQNRLFRLSQVTFNIAGNNGKIITPAENTESYGFVDFRDANGTAYTGTKLIASNVYFEGTTDDGSCFAIRGDNQDIEFTNVDVTLNNSKTWSIINAYSGNGNYRINGGTYNYTSTVATTGPFQFTNSGSTVEISNVNVTSNAGPVMEIYKGTATVDNCKMTNTATNAHYVACLAASGGSTLNITGEESEYTSAIPIYIYNSGATINIDGGTFNGSIAAIKADNANPATQASVVNVKSGTFFGEITPDENSLVKVDESSELVKTVDEQGKTAYVALPKDSDIAAFVGLTPYKTLSEAFEAAKDGDKIVVFKNQDITSMIPVTKSVTLDLAGHTLTNDVKQNRLFRLSQVTFNIAGNNGKIITPAENTESYGFVDFRDANGTAYTGTKLIASNVYFEGTTDDGSCFAIRGDNQDIEFTNVDVTLNNSKTWSIINAYSGNGNYRINGGTYNYTSTVATTGPFQFTNSGSTVEISNVNVTSNAGPVMEIYKGTATVDNCKMTNTATNAHYVACLAVAGGATLNITGSDSEYTSAVPVYVYNSGGTINIDGGTYNGTTAAIKVDTSRTPETPSVVNVTDGTFNGPLSVGQDAVLSLKGGSYTDESAGDYVADGYELQRNPDGTFGIYQTSTGIGNIDTSITIPADSKVYNLQGVVVAESADAIGNLPAGIYVVAGRKILVR